jgi:hypothetical protein
LAVAAAAAAAAAVVVSHSGKWHVGHAAWEMTPLYRGYDFFQGFMCSGAIEFLEKTNGNYYDMFTTVDGDKKVQPVTTPPSLS